MDLQTIFGWFNDWPLLFWIVVIVVIYVKFYHHFTGRRFALLFYTLSFFVVLDYAQRIGNVLMSPIPVIVFLVGFYLLGYYYIYKIPE